MAEHDAVEISAATPDSNDYEDRQRTYRSFLRVVRYCIAGIAVVLIFLAWLAGG